MAPGACELIVELVVVVLVDVLVDVVVLVGVVVVDVVVVDLVVVLGLSKQLQKVEMTLLACDNSDDHCTAYQMKSAVMILGK